MPSWLPAFSTKDLPFLTVPFASTHFRLKQSDDNGITTGTTLWLGAQCLSAFLAHSGVVNVRCRAIELGGGIGLVALSLAHLGCDVITTDLPSVISACLAENVQQNLSQLPPTAGHISVRELDWTVPSQLWAWDNDSIIASPAHTPSAQQQQPLFDLVVSSDTIYSTDLIEPFLRTLHALCAAPPGARAPVAYICLERRDPALIDEMLEQAKGMGFSVTRTKHHKVSKALRKSGAKWDKEDWEGVELWKLVLK